MAIISRDHENGYVNSGSGLQRILAAHDVQVGAADRRQRDANDRLADSRMWPFNFLDANVVYAVETVAHIFSISSPPSVVRVTRVLFFHHCIALTGRRFQPAPVKDGHLSTRIADYLFVLK